MKGESVKYFYKTELKWKGEKKGTISCMGKPDIEVACPPEFGGHENIWSPEDLFLSSVEVCTMTTFLWFVQKEKIHLKSYESKANAIAELVGNNFQFSSIIVNLKIGVSSEDEKIRIFKILKKIPSICIVSKSIKADVKIDAEISLI